MLTDTLGSTVALADSAGAVQTQYTYEPFGTTTVSGAASSNTFQEGNRGRCKEIKVLPRAAPGALGR